MFGCLLCGLLWFRLRLLYLYGFVFGWFCCGVGCGSSVWLVYCVFLCGLVFVSGFAWWLFCLEEALWCVVMGVSGLRLLCWVVRVLVFAWLGLLLLGCCVCFAVYVC